MQEEGHVFLCTIVLFFSLLAELLLGTLTVSDHILVLQLWGEGWGYLGKQVHLVSDVETCL